MSAGPDGDVDVDVDVAVVGAGGAGLALVLAIDRLTAGPAAGSAGPAGPAARPAPSIAIIDPARRIGPDRTWCYWAPATDADRFGATHAWRRVELVSRAGRATVLDLDPLRYRRVPSAGYEALAGQAADRLGARRISAAVRQVQDGPQYATVRAGEHVVRARYVFDSRPAPPLRAPRTALLQHFRGWTVRFPAQVVDVDRAVLMDFRVTQPPGGSGLAFGYVLPLDACRALVEYTCFSPARLASEQYDRALRDYLGISWPQLSEPAGTVGGTVGGVADGVADGVRIEAVEDGVIPMSDACYPRRTGRRVFRLGTAGGATRGSTGYTFAAMQRQAAAVADALVHGRDPIPPPAYPARHRWMDAVLLRAIDRRLVDGPELLLRLLAGNPPARMLDFLDGRSSIGAELAVMAGAPQLPMLRATAGDAAARLVARLRR